MGVNIELQFPDYSERTIYINEEINPDSAGRFISALNNIDSDDANIARNTIERLKYLGVQATGIELPPIKVMLNSPGGYVYDALAIYDMINRRSDIVCVCNGKVMSAAVLVLCAFDKSLRVATENTTFMIHQPSSATWGKLKDMQEDVEETKRLHKLMTGIYLKSTDIPKELLDRIYNEKTDYYFTAKEALKLGLINKII